jgi:hypothetical protein
MRLAMLRSRGSDAHSRRGARLQACALAVSLAASLCALVVPLALATGARRAAIQGCATSGLVIWLNAEDSGAAGNFYYHLEFGNQSGRTCMLAGYPGLSACDPATAAGFRVYPPGQRASRLVPFPFRTCSNIHESAISVRSVSAR